MKVSRWELTLSSFAIFFDPDLGMDIFFEKEGNQNKAMLILK